MGEISTDKALLFVALRIAVCIASPGITWMMVVVAPFSLDRLVS